MRNQFVLAFLVLAVACFANAYTPYREFEPFVGTSPNSCPNVTSTPDWLNNLVNTLNARNANRLVLDQASLNAFAEDYGHWVHRQPQAVFAATSAADVSALIRAAYESRIKGDRWAFQVVNRGGSGNTDGFAQPLCGAAQVVMDLTALNTVEIDNNKQYAWVGAGASWLDFVLAANASGVRPTVIPDYLGITVGGISSIGGFGSDAIRRGPVIQQIESAQVVRSNGDIITVDNSDFLLRAMKGGMGQFGVFIKFQFKLIPNSPKTRIFHVLVPTFDELSQASRQIIKRGQDEAHGLQAFGTPNDRASLIQNVASDAELTTVNDSVNRVLSNGKRYVYYLELLVRGNTNLPTVQDVKDLLKGTIADNSMVFSTDYATSDWDNRLKLTLVPFLFSLGIWGAPHPWASFNFDGSKKTETYFDSYLQGQDFNVDIGQGLIAVYPFPVKNAYTLTSHVGVPHPKNEDIFWHLTLGRTVSPFMPKEAMPAAYASQAAQNRILWDGFEDNGSSAAFYPCGVLPNLSNNDWERHFGPVGYALFKGYKFLFDTRNVFADVRNLF
jgi:hypothetical protein